MVGPRLSHIRPGVRICQWAKTWSFAPGCALFAGQVSSFSAEKAKCPWRRAAAGGGHRCRRAAQLEADGKTGLRDALEAAGSGPRSQARPRLVARPAPIAAGQRQPGGTRPRMVQEKYRASLKRLAQI